MQTISLNLFQDTELLSILIIGILITAGILCFFHFIHLPVKKEKSERISSLSFVRYSKNTPHFTNKDFCSLILITALYALVSFWQLGSTVFPATTWQPTSETGIQDTILELTDSTHFSSIYTIYDEGDNNSNTDTYQLGIEGTKIYGSNDLISWDELTTCETGSIYEYSIYEGNWNYKYIKISSFSKNNTLTEIAFRNADSNEAEFLPVSVYQDSGSSSKYPATLMIDEQDKMTAYPTYLDEAYFDEIYHPRNAWEIANGQSMYATVHPLLGTNLMAFSIKLFGMNPLAWRIPGAVFGVLLIPMFYLIMKRMFKNTSLCTVGSILLAADFMHLTTSRIGTLEPFSVFFILLMFYFMIRYIQTSFYDTSLRKQMKLLCACGIAMGLGIATKWTACYSAVGLALLLFAKWIQEGIVYIKANRLLKKNDDSLNDQQKEEAQHIVSIYPDRLLHSILFCFLFFIIIPVIIYWLCYLPDHVWKGDSWSIANVWKQIQYMYNYHINLKATHPYSSTWNQWLLDLRPIWYYYGADAQALSHSISCFSNPLLTWAGLPAIIFVFIDLLRRRTQNSWIILVGYLTALCPWIIITRCVFAYHFYPTSFFAILAIVYACAYIEKCGKIGKILICIFLIAYICLFLAFLPVTAGFGTNLSYIKSLEWFSTWYFG
jgi:predicted membrane-bound dolichyl-phosphate-mannose-protein mannosyltransferase